MLPGATQAPQGLVPPAPDHAPMLDSMFTQAKAKFDAISKADGLMSKVRKELDTLTEKGPAVTQDDVLDGMAQLVAHGIDPKTLTGLMAGNPQTGEPPMPLESGALAQWLGHQDQVFAQQEAALKPQLDLARHQMGVAALHSLVHNHVTQGPGGTSGAVPNASPGPPPSPSNPLGGGS